jgi:hypothetical protein
MSQEAKDIERARRLYVAAMGTLLEGLARANLERIVAAVKGAK